MFRRRTTVLAATLAVLLSLASATEPPTQCSAASTLTTSGVCVAVRYIEGCYKYESIQRCASCEFNYDLVDGECDYNPKQSSKCCLQFDDKGQCSQCETGLFLKDGACEQATLIGCLDKTEGKCLNCANGFYLVDGRCRHGTKGCSNYNQDGICTACQAGFAIQEGKCTKKTILGCAEQTNTACTKCYDPFILDNDVCAIPNCSNSNDFGCLECADGYYLRDGACQQHIKGCHYYQRGKCGACHVDYIQSSDGCISEGCSKSNDRFECLECTKPFELKNKKCVISNCLRHANGKCASCQPNFNLRKGLCVPSVNYTNFVAEACLVCAPSFYINKASKCSPFDIGCTTYVNGQCTNCVSPFEITSDGSCIIDGCDTVDSNGCVKCQGAYQPDGKICKLPNCEKAHRGVCESCIQGYIVKSGLCSQMDPNCIKYTKDGLCVACIDGYHPDSQGKCRQNVVGCVYTGSDCTSCTSPFTFADGICAIVGCEEYAVSGCLKCTSDMYLVGGICKQKDPGCQYDSSGKCQSCSDKFTYNNGQCVIQGCTQYSLDACISCSEPYRQNNGQCSITNCLQTSNGKCAKCVDGYQPTTTGSCRRFIDNCNDYDGDNCQTCKGGFFLAAAKNQCFPTLPGCVYREGACAACSDGFLFDTGVCWKVDPYCLAQSRDHKCTSCANTFYVDTAGACRQGDLQCTEFTNAGDGKCKRCQQTFYINELSGCSEKLAGCQYKGGKCVSCTTPFSFKDGTCQITGCLNYSSQGCTSCSPTYSLVDYICRAKTDGSCVEFDNGGLCTKCERGYSLIDGHCEVRDSKCLKSTVDGKCLECNAGYFLTTLGTCENQAKGCKSYKNGQCVECIARYFLWQGICFPFVEGCLKYTGKYCSECSTNYKLAQGICVKKMKDWSFGDLFTKKVEIFQKTNGTVPTTIQSRQAAAGSAIGKLTYSSLYNFSYLSYQVTDKVVGFGGWRSKESKAGEWVGLSLRVPQTFYQVQIQKGDDDSYVSEFTVQFKLNNEAWKQIPQVFTSKDCSTGQVMKFDFITAVAATDIRIVVQKFVKWPACRFDFIYNNFDERNEWQGIRNIAEIDKKIAGTMGARLDNQLDINIRNFFVPTRDCQNKEQCWSGAQFCQPKTVTGFSFDQNDGSKGTITEVFVDYSLDSLLFVCVNDCKPVSLAGLKSIVFDRPLKAKKIRVHPTKWNGAPEVRFSFDYS